MPGMDRYDEWKTTPPDDEPKKLRECFQCNEDLVKGQEVFYDSRDDEYYCSKTCLIESIKLHPDDLDEYVDILKERHDVQEISLDE